MIDGVRYNMCAFNSAKSTAKNSVDLPYKQSFLQVFL